MNSQNHRESALILQFPPPGARLRNSRGAQENGKNNRLGYEISPVVCGGAWYHEAAMIESGQPRKP